jgi:hypothetical protein
MWINYALLYMNKIQLKIENYKTQNKQISITQTTLTVISLNKMGRKFFNILL